MPFLSDASMDKPSMDELQRQLHSLVAKKRQIEKDKKEWLTKYDEQTLQEVRKNPTYDRDHIIRPGTKQKLDNVFGQAGRDLRPHTDHETVSLNSLNDRVTENKKAIEQTNQASVLAGAAATEPPARKGKKTKADLWFPHVEVSFM